MKPPSHARAASRRKAARLASAQGAARVSPDPDILVGPGLGRDAAAIAVGERVMVAKNDPITFASEGGAAHLVEVNANDIACMGATPRWLLVTALLPHGVTPADVLNQFAELRETCRQRSVELIGGHTEIVPGLARPILVGMMLGDAAPHELLTAWGSPARGRPAGDERARDRRDGAAGPRTRRRAAGADRRGRGPRRGTPAATNPGSRSWRRRRFARRTGGVTALHDPTEGGFASAVRELAIVSGAGVEIDADAMPILHETRAVAEALGIDPLGMLASGSLADRSPAGGVPIDRARHRSSRNPGQRRRETDRRSRKRSLLTEEMRQPLPEFAVDEVAGAVRERNLQIHSPR